MKWQNKGHEFDSLGEIFKKNKDLLVIGNEESLKSIKEELDFLNTKIEYKTLKEVFSIPILSGFKLKNKTIVIADNNQETLEKLKKFKFIKHNENVFLAENFLKKYLSIYALYVFNLMYVGTSTSLLTTNICSLNCKYCMIYEPYIKNKSHVDIEVLKNDIDTFFSCFDRVRYFSITGGEPFLYPKLKEIIEYIVKNYRYKIYSLGTVTNGSIVPSDELLLTIKKYNIEFIVDNYTKNAPHVTNTYNAILKKCNDLSIKYITCDAEHSSFIKTFPPKEDYTKLSDEQLINKYIKCDTCGCDLINGKLYSCCYASYADRANLIKADKDDYYDLNEYLQKRNCTGGGYYLNELIEFRLGYSDKGYSNFCKYCNGYFPINKHFDENGVTQLERGKILEWDINKE